MAIKNEEPDVEIPQPNTQSADELEKERQEAITKLVDMRRAFSWAIDRAPTLEKCLAYKYLGGKSKRKGKIILPRNFHSDLGNDSKVVWADEDLNRVVHNWYTEVVQDVPEKTANHPKWINYVTTDEIQARRHEYLGPAPRVAGYQLGDDGAIHIQFWDAFLQDAWVDDGDWQIDAVQDSQGKWVEAM